jgi:hypothetical protein
MVLKFIYSIIFYFCFQGALMACDCPFSRLGMDECNKYEIIFRGRIKSLAVSDSKFSEAVYEISELYKGNATKLFKVLYNNQEECSQTLVIGQEWIIYANYKQLDKAKLEWCSRSRRAFNNAKEDFYTITYGNDYDDELKFLQQNLGTHRFLSGPINQSGNRNQLPNNQQSILIALFSVFALILFYYLFNKFFK